MTYPKIHSTRVQEALNSVTSHPKKHLEAGFRFQVYSLVLHQHEIIPQAIQSPWDVPRARLAYAHLLSARKVAPIWFEKAPDDERFNRCLYYIEGLILQNVDSAEAQAYYWDCRSWYDELHSKLHQRNLYSDWARALTAFASAMLVVEWAANGGVNNFPLNTDYRALVERNSNFTQQGGTYFACESYAGSYWDPASDSHRRQEFWIWWLNQCIPHVWNVALGEEKADFIINESFGSSTSGTKTSPRFTNEEFMNGLKRYFGADNVIDTSGDK